MKKILQSFKKNIINLPGWRTDRKIVVIESDDWGGIRMVSKEAYDWFLKHGYKVDECPFNQNDALESNDDLELLFEVLHKVKDKNGNPPVITANNIVANPDFEKIRDSDFRKYFYEPFDKTLERYPGRDRVIKLYKEGINHHLFYPQFHGREHINVNCWMADLNSDDKMTLDAFKKNMFTVYKSGINNCLRYNLDAFGMRYDREWVSMEDIIQTGLDLFEDIWGYRSLSFIAPCYIWPVEIEKFLYKHGIKFLQGTHVQRVPSSTGKTGLKKKYHYLSQKNSHGQRYLVRNVVFEPALNPFDDSVSKALNGIKNAFKYKKPAIISSHRLNFIGSINNDNRDDNLLLLKTLLEQIKENWPNVEFLTSCELGSCIKNRNM